VATFIGRDGREEIRAEDVAGRAGTIPYEIVCRIGRRRVDRLYR
jgi:alanine racemase